MVGIAARLNPVKDIATLVRGFAKAHQECPSLRLLIAGDGEQMSMLKGLAAELGVERQVCFAGWVSDTDSVHHAIDINTLTSLSETFPYSLTEGARAALPTIASRVGGVPYLIEHGVHGLLFEVAVGLGLAHLQILDQGALGPVHQPDLVDFLLQLDILPPQGVEPLPGDLGHPHRLEKQRLAHGF